MSVYFAAAGPYVKIGYSRKPVGRSATITLTGTRPADLPRGTEVDLLGWVPGDTQVEREWHFRFAADWVAGEWFYIDPERAHEAIWADPCGIDFQRMGGLAVLVAIRNPGISRQQLADAGLQVEARDIISVLSPSLTRTA